jgi:signal peptidase I
VTIPVTQTNRRVPARWGDGLLTVGAVLGVVCILLTVSGFAFGVRPLIFRSGSMAPEIPTGSLGLADTVDASSLRVGDIVSVESSSGTRVTHRVYAINQTGTAYELTLKGDANQQPDAETYVVTRADRVFFHVPLLGYVVGAAGGGIGLVLVGALTGLLLIMVVRPRGRAARHKTLRAVAGALPVVVLMGLTAPAWATFTDDATMTAGPFAATTVVPPASASCTAALLSATVSWPNPAPGYDYEVVLRRISNGAVVSTRQVTGTVTSVTYTGLTDFGLVVGAGTVDFNVEIRSRLAAAPTWTSATVRTYSLIRVLAVAVGATVSCVTV